MTDVTADIDDDLRAGFPSWTIWRSDAGYWYATRRAQISLEAIKRGLAMTVEAATAEELHAELTIQRQIGEAADV